MGNHENYNYTVAEARRGDISNLTRKLRAFSVKYVKISEDDMARTRRLVTDYVQGQVMVFCKQRSSLPILKLEYTGSVYERLKTEAADEVDVIVVLRTTRREIGVIESGTSGYVCLKARDDLLFGKYARREVNIDPVHLRDGWFYSLVVLAVNHFLHYIEGGGLQNWASRDALGNHFLGFLRALQICLERRNLPHYWISGVNLLDDISEEIRHIVSKQSSIATQKGIKEGQIS